MDPLGRPRSIAVALLAVTLGWGAIFATTQHLSRSLREQGGNGNHAGAILALATASDTTSASASATATAAPSTSATPTSTVSPTGTVSPSTTPTATPSSSPTDLPYVPLPPTQTYSSTPTPSQSASPSASPNYTLYPPIQTIPPSPTASVTYNPTPTQTVSPKPTTTRTPTPTATATSHPSPTTTTKPTTSPAAAGQSSVGATGGGSSASGTSMSSSGGSAVSPSPLALVPSSKDNVVKVILGGDVMMDRLVRKNAQTYGYNALFDPISSLISSADIAVANLEGPITANPTQTLLANGHTTNSFTFTFAPAAATALAHAGFDLVSLANNHSNNFGSAGVQETYDNLNTAGVQWFGGPTNHSHLERVVTVQNLKIAFVGYESFAPGLENIISDISRLSADGDFVIVMPHWGTEYSATSTPEERMVARQMVAAGADAIIGAHPHVVQESVYMGNVPVFYSIGNLLFDQYFSPETMKGEVVELDLVPGATSPKLSAVKTYTTSIASRKNVELVAGPVDFK